MKRLITFVVMLVPGLCLGMDRLSALSMLETGNDDAMVGKAGEISRYQVMKGEWKRVCASTHYQDPQLAKQVTLQILDQRTKQFQRIHHRNPTDFDFYVLWNAPAQALKGHVSKVVAERASRFANLCSWDEKTMSFAQKDAPHSTTLAGSPSPL